MAEGETTTGTIRRLEAQVKAEREAEAAAAAGGTPTPLDVAVATGAVTAREAGTFVLVDGLPALLTQAREVIALDGGATLDVWTVTQFTREGPVVIDRHGFVDAAS